MLRALEVQCFSLFLMLFWSCLKKLFSEYVTDCFLLGDCFLFGVLSKQRETRKSGL